MARTMRITLDLQATQTEASHGRGVGRYSESLAWHIASLADRDTAIHLCLNGNYRTAHHEVARRMHLSIGRPMQMSAYRYPPLDRGLDGRRTARTRLAEEIVRSHWLSTRPDVLHISHLGEGYAGEAVVPRSMPTLPGGLVSATLYDLIPLRFPDHYLGDPAFSSWYRAQLGLLQQCDLLLAISESSRRDAIDLLGIHPDAIRTIWGGIDSHFSPGRVSSERAASLRARLGIRSRFVLYTGGDDHRKNLRGAMDAFARLEARTRHDVQLVIVCAMRADRREDYLRYAAGAGLAGDRVVLTGYVAESDLVDLYRLCDAFVFPSWYEGFGLPVVEAMACGAPVIGGDNSSVRELIDNPDALFDARDAASIAAVLARTLDDSEFAGALRRRGLDRARAFTWERSARLALDAYAEAIDRNSIVERPSFPVYPKKRRLALFSPLPPARSGIADHTALMLPFLARHFEIEAFVDEGYEVTDAWTLANVPIHRHTEFDAMHARFDAVLYEIGNSEFHAHMLPVLEKYPGIVTLHDAYLGGLFGYLEFHRGLKGRYYGEMLDSHGPLARRYFAPIAKVDDPLFESMIELPATKRVLDQAIGLISHSPFNLEVSRRFYPRGWRAPFRVIRQMVRIRALPDASVRAAIRKRLGFRPGDRIVAAFGHIVWTKCGDVLLDGFLGSGSARDPGVKLVFVGELTSDDFGTRLGASIARHAGAGQVSVTGYLDEEAFADYLAIADVAVQLRKNSRGGTPKGVLDCMAAAVPVVVNAEASYLDYPDDVLAKIPRDVVAGDVARVLDRLVGDEAARRRLGDAGRAYVESHHHPARLACEYSAVLNEFIDRHDPLRLEARQDRLADCGGVVLDVAEQEVASSEIRRQLQMARLDRRRLLIDVSHLNTSDHGTGIQRVVRSIILAIYQSTRADFEPVAVTIDEQGRLRLARDLLARFGLACDADPTEPVVVEFNDDDIFLMLDSSWAQWGEFADLHRRLRERGGLVVTAVYDLLPIRIPEFFVEGGAAWFEGWLKAAIASSDAMVCISRSTADDLAEYIRTLGALAPRDSRIGYWHLGADIGALAEAPEVDVGRAFDRPAFLMVGTIEPRKRHVIALEACEQLWRDGVDINFVICGRRGWMVDDLMHRLATHPEAGRRLHVIEGASDATLQTAYRSALALLFPSAGEGFGLPLIEAARHGLPIIANDLPVLREVGGDAVTYVGTDDAPTLAEGLARWMSDHRAGTTPDSRTLQHLTWQESAEQLLGVVLDNRWYRTLDTGQQT